MDSVTVADPIQTGVIGIQGKKFTYSHKLSKNKRCSKILQETLLNSVSNDLLLCMVRQSHYSFILLSVNDVMLFQHCQ
jgi:hypothetical protein